jgi:hypothetical protein
MLIHLSSARQGWTGAHLIAMHLDRPVAIQRAVIGPKYGTTATPGDLAPHREHLGRCLGWTCHLTAEIPSSLRREFRVTSDLEDQSTALMAPG